MPYSLKELQTNPFYQELRNRDRLEYERKISDQRTSVQVSGSTYESNPFTLYDENGTFLSYEDPDTGLGKQGPEQEIYVSNLTPRIKQNNMLDIILKREITELLP